MSQTGLALAVVALLTAAAGACGGDDASDSTPAPSRATSTTTSTTTTTTVPPTTVPPPPPMAGLSAASITLLPVAKDVGRATAMAWKPGDPAIYVTSQTGTVHRVDGGVATVILDLSAEVPEYESGSERGLLGIAFDPRDGRMFLHFNDRNADSHVVSYANQGGAVDAASRLEVLTVDQPGVGHKGGQLAFGADGNLYVALGDGGGSRGRDAQDMTKLLGAILRIRPKLAAPGYDVPADNPFVGNPAVRSELWAKGLRNPWKFSFDRATGDLWLGDVGEDDYEEIDVMRKGQSGLNFGWYFFEATHQRHAPPPGLTPPVHEYPHSTGVAVIGGYVYRGRAIPALSGAYIFGDVTGTLWAMGADGVATLSVEIDGGLSGLGEGPDGELYAQSLADGIVALAPGG